MTASQPSFQGRLSEGEICPHLGLEEDLQTCMAYPSHWNLCHRSAPASAVRLGHQRQSCLSAAHNICPVFQSVPGLPLPTELRARSRATK